ncbi:SH3 domain-containing protein [Paracerasibacillus soli]|uniref:SH3 domain-containing protein n=1 Tax=Paracerasibacillus soli TaxID=480284 RepID=A0ABU5CU32_9BACI|nr:SH3 domain-containing protein [Virgibacillus soli]MDY0409349.1 SH3 domain-containing protein [Virgibacillus soli]
MERAYIRSGPSTESEAVAVAGFGGVYEIMETRIDEVNDMEWLHIERKDLGSEGGWISSKLLSTVSEEVADVDKISILGEKLSIPIDERLEIIGKGEQSVNSPVWGLEYQIFDDVVTGFTNTVNTSSKDEIIELFGEPQLEMKYLLFYHGEKYNYIIHLRKDGVIEKVTINDLKASFSK